MTGAATSISSTVSTVHFAFLDAYVIPFIFQMCILTESLSGQIHQPAYGQRQTHLNQSDYDPSDPRQDYVQFCLCRLFEFPFPAPPLRISSS